MLSESILPKGTDNILAAKKGSHPSFGMASLFIFDCHGGDVRDN